MPFSLQFLLLGGLGRGDGDSLFSGELVFAEVEEISFDGQEVDIVGLHTIMLKHCRAGSLVEMTSIYSVALDQILIWGIEAVVVND